LSVLPHEVRGLIRDHLQLAALEVRLASRSLMIMISAAFCIGALVALVWVGLMAAVLLSLVDGGHQPVLVILLVTALTAIVVMILFGLIRLRSRELGLPATKRTLLPTEEDARVEGQDNVEPS
jgi:hypothetical protein